MSYTRYQERLFDKSYSMTEARPTINDNILFDLATNLNLDDLTLCDIGGGTGANCASLKRIIETHFKHHVEESVVCDVSIEGLRRARSLGLQAIKVDVTHLPFHDGVFEVVLNVHVLEHAIDVSRAIRETGRIVKKGGLLYVGTPNKASNLYLPFILDYHILGRNPLHVRSGYDADQLTEVFCKLCFKRILLRYHGFWGAFCAHILGYAVEFLILLFQHILRLQVPRIVRGKINNEIKNVKNKMIAWEVKIFGNENPHSMNFHMFPRKTSDKYFQEKRHE